MAILNRSGLVVFGKLLPKSQDAGFQPLSQDSLDDTLDQIF